MPSEVSLAAPPHRLRSMGYVEDDVAPLSSFRDIPLPIIRDARTDGERARRLGDYIYSLYKTGRPIVRTPAREPLSTVFARMKRGQPGNCGHMALVLAALWRSTGRHFRLVHWSNADGDVEHIGIELY